jgi:dolichol-phosphate mannosyltransferase
MYKNLIFTATYNEYPVIKFFIKEILKLKINFDLLIIDDNSYDGTLNYLLNISKKYKFVKLIIRKEKMGLNTAHLMAFDYAKKYKYKKLITMDADLSHDPKMIPEFFKILKKKDFVIGSRYVIGGSCGLTGYRYFLSFYGNKFIKFILRIKSNEFTTSFRGFNILKFSNINFNKIKSKGYSFFMESIFFINKHKIPIYEIPICFEDRTSGKSKLSKFELIRTLFNLFRLKFYTN